ncbi:BMP family protein [Halalkalibacter hemicellulosilyticus]|uniref:Nucleoside ABC transporter n=1 Tax=Halalkalibacter hemicellulosilyticusJCM 9152 TaxID=1236971 RepID=W4QJI5_9BACI|nr:BMP family protein [Halalkalibacter hemicellulosilyticus]GAE32256.1 nucleoside ABC transporter [Halalkalibacter hemicellulosilyticusJCM 9152]
MKKVLTVLMLFVLLLAACGTNDNDEGQNENVSDDEDGQTQETASDLKIALILPERIGVNPFFQQMEDGAMQAGEDFGVDVTSVESTDYSVIEENLRVAVAEGYDLIITAAFEAEDPLTNVATDHPDQAFAIIDTVVDLPNVSSVNFNEHEAAYLLGAAAGLITETNVVGMVAAMDIPLLSKWTVGFEDGLYATNPDAEFVLNFVNDFADPARAKELAMLQASQGADFIAGAAAVGDLGVFEAAEEVGFLTAGQDVDRTEVDPEHIVLSQIKGTDAAAYETIRAFVEGSLEAGVVSYGLADDGVGLTYVTHESETPLSDKVGEDVIEQVKEIKDEIVSGSLEIPNPLHAE